MIEIFYAVHKNLSANLSQNQSVSNEISVTIKLLFQLTVVQGDISAVDCDAVVHPTNATFSFTGEVGQYRKFHTIIVFLLLLCSYIKLNLLLFKCCY